MQKVFLFLFLGFSFIWLSCNVNDASHKVKISPLDLDSPQLDSLLLDFTKIIATVEDSTGKKLNEVFNDSLKSLAPWDSIRVTVENALKVQLHVKGYMNQQLCYEVVYHYVGLKLKSADTLLYPGKNLSLFAGADTTLLLSQSLSVTLRINQQPGMVSKLSWDFNGDGIWENESDEIHLDSSFTWTTNAIQFSKTGTFTAIFRIWAGSRHFVETTKKLL